MEDWRIAVELALRLGADFDLESVDEVTDEIARLAPAHQGANAALLRRAVDGVVIPVGQTEDPVLGGPAHAISPVADSDPGVIGGPIESLVVMRLVLGLRHGAARPAGHGHPGATVPLRCPPAGDGLTLPRSTSGTGALAPTPYPPRPRFVRPTPAPTPRPGDAHGRPATVAGPAPAGPVGRPQALRPRRDGDPLWPAVSGLAAPGTIRLHPDEFGRLGVGVRASVRVTSPGAR